MPTTFDRIRANRAKYARHKEASEKIDAEINAELSALVKTALEDDRTPWKEVAELLGVSKARVYQIRDGRR